MPRYVYHLNCYLFGLLSAIVTKHLAEEKKWPKLLHIFRLFHRIE